LGAIAGVGAAVTAPSAAAQSECDLSYPTLCIPNYGYDALNCIDVGVTDFPVVAPDLNGFDGDYDGIGCES
jgi:hypothetical protein